MWNHRNDNRNNPVNVNDYFTFIQIPKTGSTTILQNCIVDDLVVKNTKMYKHEGLGALSQFIKNKPIIMQVIKIVKFFILYLI